MTKVPSKLDERTFRKLKTLANTLEEFGGRPVEDCSGPPEPLNVALAKVEARMASARADMWRAIAQSGRAINQTLLEAACNADCELAVARNPPPVRSRSQSFDAVCCALEQIRCGRLPTNNEAAEWLAARAGSLIDKKIAGSVLSLARPEYQRNRGKHRKDSPKRQELKLEVLQGQPAWTKYQLLAREGFCSEAFAALLLAADYDLGEADLRSQNMQNGLEKFLEHLGFYDKEVAGYSALVRDEGAKAARMGWGYS